MKPYKLTGSQLKTLKRMLSGGYHPPPRPATHNNATFKTLARRGAIVAKMLDDGYAVPCNEVWVPSSNAQDFVHSNGKIRSPQIAIEGDS